MTIIVAWQLFASQRAAFARHRREGGQMASVWTPLLAGIVGFALVIGLEMGAGLWHSERGYRDFDRAVVLMEQGPAKMREAEIIFQKLRIDFPEETTTRYNLAVIYARREQVEWAKIELQELLELEPDNKEARDFLRELTNQ